MDVKNNKVDANGKKRKYIYESRYQQIAVELAQKIADGWYTVGEKISARSTLASNYNVSPETARKAVNILVDLGIVTSRQGSGTYVASREKAHLFVERYKNTVSMQEIRREISDCVNRQQEELDHLSKLLKTLVGQTKRSHSTASFVPYDIRIDEHCAYLGKSIGELNIWQQTGATIVAIKRSTDYVISPGPYERIHENDVILFVGNELSKQRMNNLFDVLEESEEAEE